MDNQQHNSTLGGWDDPAGAGISVMREAVDTATPRSVAIGVAHLPAALTDVQPDEFDAAVDLALSRMASRTNPRNGELANVRAAVDQSNSVPGRRRPIARSARIHRVQPMNALPNESSCSR